MKKAIFAVMAAVTLMGSTAHAFDRDNPPISTADYNAAEAAYDKTEKLCVGTLIASYAVPGVLEACDVAIHANILQNKDVIKLLNKEKHKALKKVYEDTQKYRWLGGFAGNAGPAKFISYYGELIKNDFKPRINDDAFNH